MQVKRTPFKRKGLSGLKRRLNGFKKEPTARNEKYTSKQADMAFSVFIRQRDGKCVRCGRKDMLTCSHFWGRTHSATRYDPENCDAVCVGCHLFIWEKEKQGEYRDFKLKQLGQERYDALEKRARSIYKRSDALEDCKKLLSTSL